LRNSGSVRRWRDRRYKTRYELQKQWKIMKKMQMMLVGMKKTGGDSLDDKGNEVKWKAKGDEDSEEK
jgi:hypothetical protein